MSASHSVTTELTGTLGGASEAWRPKSEGPALLLWVHLVTAHLVTAGMDMCFDLGLSFERGRVQTVA